MFPIPFNFPFRKSNGDISTIGAEISAGGGSSYTLPTASADVKGGVKIGAGLTMDGDVLKNTNPTPAIPYTLPTASGETLGGVKVGTGLAIDENGVLSASGGGGGLSYVDLQFSGTMNVGNNVYLGGNTYPQLDGKTIVAIYPLTNHAQNIWVQNVAGTTAHEMTYPLSGSTTYYWYADLKINVASNSPLKVRVWVV